MTSICLNMIVKNEAGIIQRCLDSVLPHIQAWAILDTGSTDGTQDLIRRHLGHLPGELSEAPWTDFARARTQALERAGTRADYILIMDADDVLEVPPGFAFPVLTADAYSLALRRGTSFTFRRTSLVRAGLPWHYVGVLHEYLDCRGPFSQERLEGPEIRCLEGGARNGDPEKYLKDARILEEAVRTDPNNARHVFYLAQSYRDAGLQEKALAGYLRRAAMKGWEEETWVALYEAAKLMENLDRPEGEVLRAYLKAYEFRPTRAESLCCLARYLRCRNDFASAHLFAAEAAALPLPPDILFLDESFYQWRALDEFAVAAYWIGRMRECRDACTELLKNRGLPVEERPRVEANRQWAETGMANA